MNTLAIIGLGYVGLPLAVEFGKKYSTIGFDINKNRIDELVSGVDRTNEVDITELSSAKNLKLSNNIDDLRSATIYIVTVPTPIDNYKKPDLSPLLSASKMIGEILKKGDIVIYESTVYPGCTEEDCVPELEKASGLQFNTDFFCGYSPERINPGDKANTLRNIKKVTSGSTPEIASRVDELYKSIIQAGTHKAPSIKVAEASKAIENAQRDLNISFVNELALIFDRIGIDTNDVIDAASTKWNFLKFKPGLVGGHCIGVDPYYLAYKAESLGYYPQVILSGRRVNDNMSNFVADKVIKLMLDRDFRIKGTKILILGITFKENCPDVRNTKVIDMYKRLSSFGLNVDILDPLADKSIVLKNFGIKLITSTDIDYSQYNGVILAVSHSAFNIIDFKSLKERNIIIYDLKGSLNKNHIDGRL